VLTRSIEVDRENVEMSLASRQRHGPIAAQHRARPREHQVQLFLYNLLCYGLPGFPTQEEEIARRGSAAIFKDANWLLAPKVTGSGAVS